ncbi:MAG: hypothetical protein ACYCYE_03650 [Clostridia bacterium]
MKKVISLFTMAVLIMGMVISVHAAPEVSTGVLKNFSEKFITLNVNGKEITYTIDTNTKVYKNDEPVDILEAARKGMTVEFKKSGSKATEIKIPNYGFENSGVLSFSLIDTRENTTDSSRKSGESKSETKETRIKFEEIGEEESNRIAYWGELNKIVLGNITLVPETLKVVLNGNALKVIDAKAEFDAKVVGDEVKLTTQADDPTALELLFEKNFSEDTSITQDKIQEFLSVTYKVKLYKQITTDIYNFPISENVVVDLNGKPSTLIKALNWSTSSYITTNTDGEVIHIDAIFDNFKGIVDGVKNGKISVSVVRNNKVVMADTLELSPGVTVYAADGSVIDIAAIKVKDEIKLSVNPFDAYKVNVIEKINK